MFQLPWEVGNSSPLFVSYPQTISIIVFQEKGDTSPEFRRRWHEPTLIQHHHGCPVTCPRDLSRAYLASCYQNYKGVFEIFPVLPLLPGIFFIWISSLGRKNLEMLLLS